MVVPISKKVSIVLVEIVNCLLLLSSSVSALLNGSLMVIGLEGPQKSPGNVSLDERVEQAEEEGEANPNLRSKICP